MLPAFVLSLREGLEAALIIGIVLGALQKYRRSDLSPLVWSGVGGAVVLSLAAALVLNSIGASFEGRSEQIFEGITMLLAAAVLTWMIFWMSRQARYMRGQIESDVYRAALKGGGVALFLLAFTAVLREGVELVLFLTATALAIDGQQVLLGAFLGLGTAVLLGWLLFKSIVRLELRRFFIATGVLLVMFAAGLVAHGVDEFNEAGWIPEIVEHVWDINFLLDEKSVFGQILTALFGYNGNPSLSEVLAYVFYFVLIFIGIRRSSSFVTATQEA